MGNLFQQKYPNNIRTISGLVNVPYQDDSVLECNTSLGAVVINLLDIPTNWSTQYKLYIVDKSNNASVNNITINAPVGYKVNGGGSMIISANGGSVLIRVISGTNYVGQYSVIGGGGGVAGHIIADEGVNLPQQPILDFLGANVTVTNGVGRTIVTITGSGASIIDITNAGLLALVTAGTVVAGQFYRVTDALLVDEGVVVQGIRTNGVTTVNGAGVYLNADYQMVGNYSGVAGFVSAIGLWGASVTPVVAGNCVVWNNANYKNLTGVWGTDPSTDVVNWVLLTKSDTNGYIREVDFVKYNITLNSIIYRADKRLNEVDFSVVDTAMFGAVNTLVTFQWGRNPVIRNKVFGRSVWYCTNSSANFNANVLNSGEIYDFTEKTITGQIRFNKIDNLGKLELAQTNGKVEENYISGENSRFIIFGGLKTISVDAIVKNNRLTSGGAIILEEMIGNGLIDNNEATRNSSITLHNISGQISTCLVSNNGVLQLDVINAGAGFNGCEVSDKQTVPILGGVATLYQYKKIKAGYSNWEITLTIADFLGGTLTIPIGSEYGGIFTTVGLDPVVIDKIVNLNPNHISTFKATAGGIVNFLHTLVGLAVANNLLCDAPASLNVLVGRVNGSDFNQYQVSGNLVQRTNVVINA